MATQGSHGKLDRNIIAETLIESGKLGLGALTHPETARWIARVVLFERMGKLMRRELGVLRDTCLPLYEALFNLGRQTLPRSNSSFPDLVVSDVSGDVQTHRRHCIDGWFSLRKVVPHCRPADELAAALSKWAVERYMMTDWFLDETLRNLSVWHILPQAAQGLWWLQRGSLADGKHDRFANDSRTLHGKGTFDRIIPVPVIPLYNPSAQTREEHRHELDALLNNYYAKQESLFEMLGFRKTVLKRARTRKNPWVHWDWFIKFQMQKQPGSDIANEMEKKYGLEIAPDAIHTAVRDVARVLEVPVRGQVKGTKSRLNRKKLNS